MTEILERAVTRTGKLVHLSVNARWDYDSGGEECLRAGLTICGYPVAAVLHSYDSEEGEANTEPVSCRFCLGWYERNVALRASAVRGEL